MSTQQNLKEVQTYVDFVKQNLEPLAEHLKVSVEWLWNILVMQARVEAVVMLIVVISMSVVTTTLAIVFFKHFKKSRYVSPYVSNTLYKHRDTGVEIDYLTEDWENRKKYDVIPRKSSNKEYYISLVSGLGAAIMMAMSVITSASTATTIVTGLMNPEFRAIEKIVEFAKPAAESVKNNSEKKQ